MITLAPIDINIQRTLLDKISMLKKSSGGGSKTEDINGVSKTVWTPPEFAIGTIITDSNGAPPENYMMTRTPFIRLTSLTPRGTNGLEPVIIMGGQLDKNNNLLLILSTY